MNYLRRKYVGFILAFFALSQIASARRVWEPSDVMPMLSTNNAVALEMGELHLWIATRNGILRMPYIDGSPVLDAWEAFPFEHDVHDLIIRDDTVYVFAGEDAYAIREFDLFDRGFSRLDSIPRFAPNIAERPMLGSNLSLPTGLLWLSEGYIRDIHSNDFEVVDCATDNLGNIILATNGLGMFMVRFGSSHAEHLDFGPCCNYVSAMAKSDEKLVFAGCMSVSNCILTVYDDSNGSFNHIQSLPNPAFNEEYQINGILGVGDYYFVAGSYGLEVYDHVNREWLRALGMNSIPIHSANALAALGDTIYIASDDGVFSASIETRAFRRISPPDGGRFTDIVAVNAEIYASGASGVWSLTDSLMTKFDTPDGTITNFVECATVGPRGELVFGSRTGILIIHPGGKREILSNALDLGGLSPNDIIATLQYLWIATDRGLFVYNRRTKTILYLGRKNYLPEMPIESLFLDGDWLWLLTPRGAFRFFWNEPDRLYR